MGEGSKLYIDPKRLNYSGESIRRMMLELRPHHIYCPFFMETNYSDRGKEFQETSRRLKEVLRKDEDVTIKFGWGADRICETCNHYDPNRKGCAHPRGDEEEVQKWDHKILKGLGINRGDTFQLDDLHQLIREKYPLKFCVEKCPYKRERCDPNSTPHL